MTILLFSGIAAHRTCDNIQYVQLEKSRTTHILHGGHSKRIKVKVKDEAVFFTTYELGLQP